MPPPNTHVLIWYRKGEDQMRTGKTGDFLVEGYFDKKRSTWFDYTNRKLLVQKDVSNSKNKILMWADIPDDFIHD
jgi:hypothetical protein